MKSHCQPFKPQAPFNCRSASEIGAPISTEIGMAIMNSAPARARYAVGTQ